MLTGWDLGDVFSLFGEVSFLVSFKIVSEGFLFKSFSDDVKESC